MEGYFCMDAVLCKIKRYEHFFKWHATNNAAQHNSEILRVYSFYCFAFTCFLKNTEKFRYLKTATFNNLVVQSLNNIESIASVTSLGTGRYNRKSLVGDAHPFAPASCPTVSKRTSDTSVYVNAHCLQTYIPSCFYKN